MYRTPVGIDSFLPLPALLESAHCLAISFHFSCKTYRSPSAAPSMRVSSQPPLHQKKYRHPPTHNSDTNSAALSSDWLPHVSKIPPFFRTRCVAACKSVG